MTSEPDVRPRARPRRLTALTFPVSLLALGAIALAALRTPPRIVTGLPVEPEVARVTALVRDRLGVGSGALRFRSALLDDAGHADQALAIEAGRILRPACLRRPRDPRLLAAAACLDLAAHRHAEAERLYRRSLDLAPTYGEARLGLGVTLALRATAEGDEDRARGLRLRAISQFAAVPAEDPCHEPALFDRALLLVRVERAGEARALAREYFARDSASTWALALMRELDALPR